MSEAQVDTALAVQHVKAVAFSQEGKINALTTGSAVLGPLTKLWRLQLLKIEHVPHVHPAVAINTPEMHAPPPQLLSAALAAAFLLDTMKQGIALVALRAKQVRTVLMRSAPLALETSMRHAAVAQPNLGSGALARRAESMSIKKEIAVKEVMETIEFVRDALG